MRILLSAFEKWQYDELGHGERTRYKYGIEARRSESWLLANRHKKLVNAGRDDLKAYLWSLPANARTRNNVRQALVCFYRFLIDQHLTASNPALALPRLPEPESIPKALSGAQAAKIEAASQQFEVRIQVLVAVYMYTGIRKSEARLLRWDQIDLEERWLRFRGKGRAGGKERVLPLHPLLVGRLLTWKVHCEDPRWVFPSFVRRGYPVSDTWVRDRLYEVGGMVGVHLHPHLFRHTVATLMLERGVDLRSVQEFLGHSSLGTTQIYTRVRPARLREAVAHIEYVL